MKIVFLIAFLSLAATAALAQYEENSVCADPAKNSDPKKVTVLVICNRGTGMSALPRLRLNLRVYADGTAEYEENAPENGGNFTLEKHTIKVSLEDVARIVGLGAARDFQDAKADYPLIRMWTDSGLETTVTFRDKKILVRNYSASDPANEKHYPPSLVKLLALAYDLRNPVKTSEIAKPPTAEPVSEYNDKNRTLEVGKTYRGKVNFGDAYGMRLTPFPRLPYHHSVMYRWPNVKDFPALDPDKDFGVRTIVFKVVDREADNFRKNDWITTFTIEIVKVVE